MSVYQSIGEREGRRVLQLTSPVDLETTKEIVCANSDDVAAAIEKARKAQPAWSALGFKARAQYMQKAIKVMMKDTDEIMQTVINETGKAPTEAFIMEVWSAVDSLAYYAKHAEKFLSPQMRKAHGMLGFSKKVRLIYQPLGVVGIISPWNGPLILAMNPGVQALMAGNTVIVKGSEVTPASTQLAEMVFKKAGLPDGVFKVLMGDGQTGADLVEGGVDKIAFTGSVATGRKVAEACGRQLIPCTMELGGKDAMIVCDDANIERASSGALIGSMMNTGHYCCGTERIYVSESVYDEFVSKVVEKTKQLRQGPEFGDDEDVGAIFWDRQMDIIERHVEDAKQKGATIMAGGQRNPKQKGLYFEPTVMTDVNHDMLIMKEETFGPIICIQKVKDEDEAMQLANDSPYGLSGNIWTKDNDKGLRLAEQMQTGSICLNDFACTYGVPVAPFGGLKDSGVGQVNGKQGLRSYCHAKPIIIDKAGHKDKLQAGYPYDKKKLAGMKKFMRILWGTRLGHWLS